MSAYDTRTVATMAGAFVLSVWLARQVRRPSRIVGRAFLWLMNRSHANMTEWGLSQVPIADDATVLDVGCGGGRTIARIASGSPSRRVSGVDYSAESVATSRRTNAAAIAQGQVKIEQADVSKLPFDADTFDVVTAVETHYYWPDVAAGVREIRRVLRPGGQLAIMAETYRGETFDLALRPVMALIGARYLTVQEHRALLEESGFVDAVVETKPGKGWLCAVGRRPA